MVADGALLRRFFTGVGVTAVETHPLAFHIGDKQFILLQQVSQHAKTIPVYFFDCSDHTKRGGNLWKAFLLGGIAEMLVGILVFLVFVVMCLSKQLNH